MHSLRIRMRSAHFGPNTHHISHKFAVTKETHHMWEFPDSKSKRAGTCWRAGCAYAHGVVAHVVTSRSDRGSCNLNCA